VPTAGQDHGSDIARTVRRLDDRYGVAGVLILACIVVLAFAGDGTAGRLVVVALEAVTLLVILHTSHAHPRTIQTVALASVLAIIAVALGSTGNGRLATAAPGLLGALLALVAPIVIARRLVHQPTIDFTTVAGALCIYLLAGLFFAFLYWSIGIFHHNQFFAQSNPGSGVDFVYFSFVTLTTVGYGDLTAAFDAGRIASIFEALFGQLYLVSVVALLVANLGRERRVRD
jgi:hypothetical protein